MTDRQQPRPVQIDIMPFGAGYIQIFEDKESATPMVFNTWADVTFTPAQMGVCSFFVGGSYYSCDGYKFIDVSGLKKYTDDLNNTNVPIIQNPMQLANCTYWLDAQQLLLNAGGTQCASGDDIATIPDVLGTSVAYTLSSTKPKYVENAINGYPAIDINANSYINLTGFLTSAYANAITVFVVVKAKTALSTVKVLWGAPSIYAGITGSLNSHTINLNGVTFPGTDYTLTSTEGVIGYALGASTFEFEANKYFLSAKSSSIYTNSVVSITGSITATGQDLTIGGITTNYNWPGYIGEVIIYNRQLTQSEFRSVYDYLSEKWGYHTKPAVVCVGDSLTAGSYSSGLAENQIANINGTNYPSRLMYYCNNAWEIRTDSRGGRTLDQIAAESPYLADMLVTRTANKQRVAVIFEIINTLIFANKSVGYTYNMLIKCCEDRRAAGYKVVVCTAFKNSTTSANQTKFNQINALIRKNYAKFADGLCDLAADSRLANPLNTTYFYSDGVHLVDAGYDVMAQLIYPEVAKLIK